MDRQECSSELIKRLELVVVGASSGGLETLIEFLQALPEQYQVPTVVVLHQRANRVSGVPEMLSKYTHLKVVEPEDKQKIETGCMYIAPPNYHLLIDADHSIALSLDAPLNYSRPSIDMAFISASEVYEQHLAGCIFTGANSDGADGCVAIKRNGGTVFVQDPVEASVDTMPLSAIKAVRVDGVLSIHEIAGRLVKMGARSNAS
ncbi:MAG: chemotaxis protein CheB [Ketobacter sp.]|nr:MAG: chemotaxis protein CheB [Ketobacter sp.]